MKITIGDLIEKKACLLSVKKYQLSDLEKIDWSNVKKIIVYNNNDFKDLEWLQENFKIPNTEIQLEYLKGDFQNNIYNENDLLSQRENSGKLVKKFFYNDSVLLTKVEYFDGTFSNYTYNKDGLLLKFERSDGYCSNYKHDKKGKLIDFDFTDSDKVTKTEYKIEWK